MSDIHCESCRGLFYYERSLFTSGYLYDNAEKFVCYDCYEKLSNEIKESLSYTVSNSKCSITLYRHGEFLFTENGKTRKLNLKISEAELVIECECKDIIKVKRDYKWRKEFKTAYYNYCRDCGRFNRIKLPEDIECEKLNSKHKKLINYLNNHIDSLESNFERRFKQLLWKQQGLSCRICNRIYDYDKEYVKKGSIVFFDDKNQKQAKEFECYDCRINDELYENKKINKKNNNKKVWSSYKEYLLSNEWKQKRYLIILRCQNICEGCRENKVDNVHHLTYDNVYNEFLFELVGLCKDCHERFHKKGEYK